MKLEHILEGLLKRSDPYISGEESSPQPKRLVKKTPFQANIARIAAAAGVSEDRVKDLWIKHSGQVDPKNMNKWAIVTARVKRDLGL